MIVKIITEAQKLMTNVKRGKAQGNQDFTEAAVEALEKREGNFSCIYCDPKNIEGYHAYRKIVGLNLFPTTWTPTPFLANWEEFRLHFEVDHPEQWGRSEIDPVGKQGRGTWTDLRGKKDRRRAVNVYLNIRAYPEYGWNPFLLIRKPGARVPVLWNYRDGPNPTLMGVPDDESKRNHADQVTTSNIVGIKWEPRCDPEMGKLWDTSGEFFWKLEKEARTHTRAQNAVGPQLNRSLNAVRRILRGSNHNATNLADGCALVKNEEENGHFTIDLSNTPYKSLYTINCLLHKRALSHVSAIRLRLGLEGQGNIGQLQVVERWQASKIPHFVAPNGIVEADEKEIADRLAETIKQQATTNNTTEKKEIKVEPLTPSTDEDTTVAVEETAEKESAPNIELDALLVEVRHLCPNTNHFDNVFDNIEAVFEYTRNLQNQLGDWNLTHLQEQVDNLKVDVSNSKANENDARQELQDANNKLATLGKDSVSATTHAELTQANADLVTRVAELQNQLDTRPVSKQQQMANASIAMVKSIQKSGNITVS